MGRRSISFISYNPYIDQKIDPISSDDLFKYPGLPHCIHDAVFRAKKLATNMPIEQLREQARLIDGYLLNSSVPGIKDLEKSGRDYGSADESDQLKSYLNHAEHDIPNEQYSVLFGVLALSLAGEIVNTLWPSENYLQEIGPVSSIYKSLIPNYEKNQATEDKSLVAELAIEAVRAVGFGEGVLYEKLRATNARNARKAHDKKGEIFQKFNEWALALEAHHPFSYPIQAARYFIDSILHKENLELYRACSETTPRTMCEKLAQHCKTNGLENPIKKKS